MPRYFAPEERYNKFKQWREQRNLDAAGTGPQAPADPVWQSVARNVGTGPAPVLPPAPQPTPMPPPQLSVSDAWMQGGAPAIAPNSPVPSSMTVPSAWLAPYSEPAPLRLPKVPAFSAPTPAPPDGMNWQTADQMATPPTPTIPLPTRPYRNEAVDADLDALAAVPRDLAGAGLGAYNEFIGRPVTGLATELTGGREQEAYERQRGLPERADTGGDLGNWWRALSERQRARSEAGIASVPLGDVLPFTPGEYAGIARGVAPVARGLLGEVNAVAKSAPVAKGLQAVDRLATSPIVGKIAPGLGIEDVSKAAEAAPTSPLPKMVNNYRKPLSDYTDAVYHETSLQEAVGLMPQGGVIGDSVVPQKYLANTPNLALGQGKSKGVLLEFDAAPLQGQVNTAKPTWQATYDQGQAEFIATHNNEGAYRQALRSITVRPDAGKYASRGYQVRMQRLLESPAYQDWAKIKSPDGSITYTRPDAPRGGNSTQGGTLIGTPPEIGGAVAGGAYGAAQPAESEQERAQNIIKGAAGGALVGSGARAAGKVLASKGAKGPFSGKLGIADDAGRVVPEGAPKKKLPPEIEQPIQQGAQQELQGQQGTPPISVEDITKSTNAANRTLGEMYAKPTGSAAPGIIDRMEAVRRAIVRAATDEGVDLAKFQQQAAKAKGAPLSADEMAYELKRLNPDKAAQVALDENLRPAIQGIGQDQPWLSVYLTHQDNIDVAKAMGNQARKFSGGLSVADSRQALQDMATELGPERFQAVQQAAQQVQDFGRQLLARKRDAGLITDQLYKDLTDMYPHYVPTRITDYMKDPMNIPVGKSLSVRDTGLRRNTVEGTIRAREDPLASMVRNAYETEAIARKNETFNAFVKLSQMDPELQAMVRKVPDSYTTTRAEAKVTGFVNGVRETYVVPKALEYVIKSEAKALIPGFAGDVWGAMMGAFRAGATSRNPVFLASNATLDAATYGVRESSRAGGPQALPKIITELVSAYGDAFQGVLSGTYHGDTAEFLKAGGGQFGFFQGTPGKARQTLQGLKRGNVFTVNGLGDIGRLTKDILTLKPVEGLGERIELAPRVASYRLTQKAGKNATQAVINGRTVTMDFSQGGTVSKVVNGFIPFFNVGMQAFPQVVRAAKENPRGFLATTAALLAGPVVAAEAWNRSDPQRAKDYEDVPQYLKDQGVVIMLPQPAPTGTQGDRRPQFVQIRLREFAPFAIVAREAAGRVMGEDPRSWGDLIMSSIGAESPIQGNNPADALSSFSPLGVSTALQLALNKDLFRNRMIDTKGANERASAVGKTVGGALGVSPSQVDFTVRDLASGVGGTALAAGDLVAGKAPRSSAPQDMPVVGGVYGRFVKGNTGDRLDKARQNLLTPEAKEILKAAGVDLPLQPVGYTINNVPLMMNEEEKYQVLTNRYIDEAIRTAANLPRWGEYSADLRAKAIQSLVSGARERAGAEVLKDIGAEEMKRRLLAVKK